MSVCVCVCWCLSQNASTECDEKDSEGTFWSLTSRSASKKDERMVPGVGSVPASFFPHCLNSRILYVGILFRSVSQNINYGDAPSLAILDAPFSPDT